MRAAFRAMREILAQPAIARHSLGEIHPGPDVRTDAEIDAFVRRAAGTVYHPVGTCRMGAEPDAVGERELPLRGIEGSRGDDPWSNGRPRGRDRVGPLRMCLGGPAT